MEPLIEVKKKKLDIKEIRTRLGETQEVFGARFGVTAKTVRNWEKGIFIPAFLEDGLKFHRLLKQINCSYDDVAIPVSNEQLSEV